MSLGKRERKPERRSKAPAKKPLLPIIFGVTVAAVLIGGALLALQPKAQAPAPATQAPLAQAAEGTDPGLSQPTAQAAEGTDPDLSQPAEQPAENPAGGPANDSAAEAVAIQPEGNEVRLALSDMADGKARFYSVQAEGKTVPFFVLKGSDGEVRAALDACVVCYGAKRGYHQEGDVMVCNNCGNRFPSSQINVITGGCNPVPLERQVRDGSLILNAAELAAGAQYF